MNSPSTLTKVLLPPSRFNFHEVKFPALVQHEARKWIMAAACDHAMDARTHGLAKGTVQGQCSEHVRNPFPYWTSWPIKYF